MSRSEALSSPVSICHEHLEELPNSSYLRATTSTQGNRKRPKRGRSHPEIEALSSLILKVLFYRVYTAGGQRHSQTHLFVRRPEKTPITSPSVLALWLRVRSRRSYSPLHDSPVLFIANSTRSTCAFPPPEEQSPTCTISRRREPPTSVPLRKFKGDSESPRRHRE